MKAYKVSYYDTTIDGRIPMGARPVEMYYFNKEEADKVAKEKENDRWVDIIRVEEIEIN